MNKQCTVEQALIDDVGEIVAMQRALAEYCDYDMSRFGISEQMVSHIITMSDESTYFTAQTDEGMGGMMFCHRVPLGWTGTAGVYIEDLYVSPDYRRYGIGKSLMAAACSLALNYADDNPDAAFVRLDTSRADNESTLNFYRSIGMQEDNINFRLYGAELGKLAMAQ